MKEKETDKSKPEIKKTQPQDDLLASEEIQNTDSAKTMFLLKKKRINTQKK